MARRISRRLLIQTAHAAALTCPVFGLIGCTDESRGGDVLSFGGKTMGTTYSVKLANPPSGLKESVLQTAANDVLETVNDQMSTYRAHSEISRVNAAKAGTWTLVSTDTLTVIDKALDVARMTGGAFDPTVGPIVDLWGFGARGDHRRVPTTEEIEKARASIGFAKVETRSREPAVLKQADDLRIDLSALAKGFGVDKVAELLAARGLNNFLVEIGGELRSQGHGPNARPWRVGIEKPQAAPGGLQRVVDLNDAALATSGNYRIFFQQDGRHYSHIINPLTGRPVEHDLASATVIASTAMEADAYSTSILVLGPDEGMAFAKRHAIAAFIVAGNGDSARQDASPAFKERFKSSPS